MKLPTYRVRRNPKGLKAWRDSSSLVLSAAALALAAWVPLPEDKKAEVLTSLGLDAADLSLYSLIAVVLAGLIAKHTSVQKADEP